MKLCIQKCLALSVSSFIFALPLAAFGAETVNAETSRFVAGLAPYERPAGAPVILAFASGSDWQNRALKGVSEPRPTSLNFLNDQGAWYTPFIHPGIPGYYDLRRWHGQAGGSNKVSR